MPRGVGPRCRGWRTKVGTAQAKELVACTRLIGSLIVPWDTQGKDPMMSRAMRGTRLMKGKTPSFSMFKRLFLYRQK